MGATMSWWRPRSVVVALAVAGGATVLAAHARDMRRVELADTASDAYRAGVQAGARAEASRVAAEAQADAVGERLEVTDLFRDATGGIRVTGYLPPGAVADGLVTDLGPISLSDRPLPPALPEFWGDPEELDRAITGLLAELGQRFVPPPDEPDVAS